VKRGLNRAAKMRQRSRWVKRHLNLAKREALKASPTNARKAHV
jgi:hypothetical protein